MIRNNKGQVSSYKINHGFFSKPNLLNSYWAGFIAADGNLEKTTDKLVIDLATIDKEHLQNFKKCINFEGMVKTYSYVGREYVRLSFKSPKIIGDLKKNFNITPRKSLTLKPPKNLTKKQILAYVVGYIDGDGSFNKNTLRKNNKTYIYSRLSIVGTKSILNFIKNNVKAKGKIYKQNENIFQLVYYGNKKTDKVKHILNFLRLPRLKRKWQ